MTIAALFRFDNFTLDRTDERLLGPDGPVHIGNKAFRVLEALIDADGQLLTKDALFENVWKGTIVSDSALTSVIKELRRALGDQTKQPRFIESVYGRGYRFLADPVAGMPFGSISGGVDDDRSVSIAVMPFESLSSDPENAFLADGLTDDVTTTLSRMPDTLVISRASCRAFRDRHSDTREAKQELGVNYVIEGSVQASSTRLRVSVSLIDCRTGAKLWADRLERPLADLFDLQDELAASLCAQLQPNLILPEADRVRNDNVSAWAHFHKGWAIWNFNYNEEASAKAIAAFDEAIRIDPDYAPPYAALSIVYTNRAGTGWATDPFEELSKSRVAAETAARLAPDHALTHYAAAIISNAFGSRREGLASVERALELEPCNASIMALAGVLNASCGNGAKAVELVQSAMRLSPRDPRLYMFLNNLWMAYLCVGDWDNMIQACQQSLRIKREGNSYAICGLVIANVARGDDDVALENAKRLGGFNFGRLMNVTFRADAAANAAAREGGQNLMARFKALGLIE